MLFHSHEEQEISRTEGRHPGPEGCPGPEEGRPRKGGPREGSHERQEGRQGQEEGPQTRKPYMVLNRKAGSKIS